MPKRLGRQRYSWGLILVGLLLVLILASPRSALATNAKYCDEVVPAHTDCAQNPGHSWDWYNGIVYVNTAAYPGPEEINVCEHTYRRSNGATVSDNCANWFVESFEELYYYYELRIELSSHVGNNSSVPHTVQGEASY